MTGKYFDVSADEFHMLDVMVCYGTYLFKTEFAIETKSNNSSGIRAVGYWGGKITLSSFLSFIYFRICGFSSMYLWVNVAVGSLCFKVAQINLKSISNKVGHKSAEVIAA